MELTSKAFKNNEDIPSKYTCDGENISPPLSISSAPGETKGLVLIMDDPDATGGSIFDHWVMWDIASTTTELQEGMPPGSAIQGVTGFGKVEYGGPCPPQGNEKHRYMFKLYALDALLSLAEGATKENIEKAMEGHILEQTTFIGMYGR